MPCINKLYLLTHVSFPKDPVSTKIRDAICQWSVLLTHYGLVGSYGDTELGQYWFEKWLVAWLHQANTWANKLYPSMGTIYPCFDHYLSYPEIFNKVDQSGPVSHLSMTNWQLFGHQMAEIDVKNTKMNRGQETNPIKINDRYQMNWASIIFNNGYPILWETSGHQRAEIDGRNTKINWGEETQLKWIEQYFVINILNHQNPIFRQILGHLKLRLITQKLKGVK